MPPRRSSRGQGQAEEPTAQSTPLGHQILHGPLDPTVVAQIRANIVGGLQGVIRGIAQGIVWEEIWEELRVGVQEELRAQRGQ